MRPDDTLIDLVQELSLPPVAEAAARRPAPYATVQFVEGRTALLDLGSERGRVWADVLQSLREERKPAYVEIDSHTGLITELLLPIPYRVGRLERTRDGLWIDFIISHARHLLPRSHPRFDELGRALEAAQKRGTPLLVTETLEQRIVDLRPMAEEPGPRRAARKR